MMKVRIVDSAQAPTHTGAYGRLNGGKIFFISLVGPINSKKIMKNSENIQVVFIGGAGIAFWALLGA